MTVNQTWTNPTGATLDLANGALVGELNWDALVSNVYALAPTAAGPIANSRLVSRYVHGAALNVTASSGYTDFGGSFTTAITTLAGDQVRLVAQSVLKKATAGHASVVIDRGGTKLPGAATATSVYTDLIGSYVPFALEVWDSPGAGTFTYKPQVYSGDANVATAGGSLRCIYVVEVWR